ncbi:MAG: glutathione peroxidase [Ignavibacteria bacterium]|nr:glutathione peroxidase [Ignavibacteria bacterium]
MKYFMNVMMVLSGMMSFLGCSIGTKPVGKQSVVSFYSLTFTDMDGTLVPMSTFKGKKVLVVNTASRCGYTPQYAELEKLYEQYKEKLVVIGFPANNFLSQEPGTNDEIRSFCKLNYDVSFPMARKISVKGDDIDPVFTWLSDPKLNGWNSDEPKWNFYKYLIDEKGELEAVFPSSVKPLSDDVIKHLK